MLLDFFTSCASDDFPCLALQRTEYLVEKASRHLNVAASIAVFPTLVLLSFQSDDRDPAKTETHLLTVEPGLNVDKLGRADELANRVGTEHMPLLVSHLGAVRLFNQKIDVGHWWRSLKLCVLRASSVLNSGPGGV
jgi:hypothetical protein